MCKGMQCGSRPGGAGCAPSDCGAFVLKTKQVKNEDLMCFKSNKTRLSLSRDPKCLYSCEGGTSTSCSLVPGMCLNDTILARNGPIGVGATAALHTPYQRAPVKQRENSVANQGAGAPDLSITRHTEPKSSDWSTDRMIERVGGRKMRRILQAPRKISRDGGSSGSKDNTRSITLVQKKYVTTCSISQFKFCYADSRKQDKCLLDVEQCMSEFVGASCNNYEA